MSFAQLPSIHTVDRRILDSESFFRIEEAEAVADKMRKRLERRVQAKQDRKAKRLAEGKPALSPDKDVLPEVYPPPFFSAHVLNSDPTLSKFVEYDELVFPKPYTVIEGLQPDFIDKLWVSGFLDRANRDATKLAQQAALEKLQQAKRGGKRAKKFQDGDSVGGASATIAADEHSFAHSPAPGATSLAKRGGLVPLPRPDPALAHIRQQSSTISVDISNLESDVASSVASTTASADFARQQQQQRAGDKEARRQRQAQAETMARRKRAQEKAHITAMVKPYADNILDYRRKRQTGDWIPGVKERREKAQEDALAAASGNPDEQVMASFYSVDLDRIFDRERQEKEAASVIQRFWKKLKRLLPWRFAIKCMLAAARIQRLVRGAIVRKWVARWYKSRNQVRA